jgi:ribosomal biogenesis protein LAS1
VQGQAHSIRPVEPLLRRYKNLLKTVSRDASLRARHAADISGVLREIERWLAEARLAAAVHANEFASSLSYRGRHAGEPAVTAVVDNGEDDDGDDDEEPEPRETWALDRLCDALLVKGALVPISRKSVNRCLPPPRLVSSSSFPPFC